MTLKCQHLWMYEVLPNISLIFPNQSRVNHWRRFYNRLSDQMERASAMNDTMSFYNECKRVETATKINTSTYIKGVIDRNVFGYY
jgi:hypothetical protein